MNKLKQVIACTACAVLLLGNTAAAVGQPTEEQQRDLYQYHIMRGDENGDLRLGDTITRAEAVKMICVAGGLDVATDAQDAIFNDVETTHWAYGYIAAAKQNGIADGDDRGCFNPEGSVTNEEIVKLIVALLGYRPMAETRGGYPAGYTAAASQLGLTSGMQLAAGAAAVRGDVALLFSRALDVPLMMVQIEERKTEDNVDYFIADGENGLPKQTLRDGLGIR